jgi:RNA polymerase sigma factor (sigma-70 family)
VERSAAIQYHDARRADPHLDYSIRKITQTALGCNISSESTTQFKQRHAGQEQRMGIETSLESVPESVMVEQVRRMAYFFARRVTRNEVAEDVAQDVALDYVLKVRDEHWRLRTTLRALVRSMTKRKLAYRARGEKHRRDAEEQFVAERSARTPVWMDPARDFEAREDMRIREHALKKLPATTRIAFRMVNEEGATHDAVARTLGVSRQLVTHHVRRAERQLADRLLAARTCSSTPPTVLQPSRLRRQTRLGSHSTTLDRRRTTPG